jgi:hypothetical protein
MRQKYVMRPLDHLLDSSYPSLNIQGSFVPSSLNIKVEQHALRKRWGYVFDRDLGVKVYAVILFQTTGGQRYTVYLTAADAAVKKEGAGETFAYITKTYTTGTISGIAGGTVVAGGTTAWSTAGIKAGDKFIIDSDHSANVEPDANWATVDHVHSNTELVLTSAYAGAATTGTYKIRQCYSLPDKERWAWAAVSDQLCFTNGNVAVQAWTGTGTATNLNATWADGARYCMEYGNRLFLADTKDSAVRNPYLGRWSAEGLPAVWDPAVNATAGQQEFIEADDYITGLGKAGANVILYKRNSIIIGNRTGNAYDPFEFPIRRPGGGCVAPYSIVEAMSTNVWLGKEDFYALDGDYPKAIGEKMRFKFFDLVKPTEAEYTFGWMNPWENEVIWFAETSSGQTAFVWDYKTQEWYLFEFADTISGIGTGAL